MSINVYQNINSQTQRQVSPQTTNPERKEGLKCGRTGRSPIPGPEGPGGPGGPLGPG